MSLVYRIVNNVNGKSYVGQTSKSIRRRYSVHFSKLKHKSHHSKELQADYNKFGKDSFSIEPLDFAESQKDLDVLENKWIEFYQSFNSEFGYNKEKGGKIKKVGAIPTIKTGSKLSQQHKDSLKRAKCGKSYSEISYQNVKKIGVMAHNVVTNELLDFSTMKECSEYLCVSPSAVRCHIVRRTKLINKTWKVSIKIGGNY